MLNGVHLVDFGNHRNTRLTFGRMTALVGQNGAGKTTVMRGVEEVERIASHPTALPGDSSKYRRRGGEQEMIAGSWVSEDPGDDIEHGLASSRGRVHLTRRRIEGESEIWIPDPSTTKGPEDLKRFRRRRIFDDLPSQPLDPPGAVEYWEGQFRWRCRYFKTSASALQRAAVADPEATTLNRDGSNLAWALASLMTEHPDKFQRIVQSLREVVPVVKRIRSRPVSLTRSEKQTITINQQERSFDEERTVPGQELIFDMLSGDNLPAAMVSEGTLVALAVLTLVHGTDEADLIMLDDVELGLHPKAQRDLIRQLRRIQETHPQLQIILSTHSPYVVDEMKPEEVWLFAPDAEGCAVARRLDEHPNAKRALEVLTTGEFWSAEGEGWVLSANAPGADSEKAARVAEDPPER